MSIINRVKFAVDRSLERFGLRLVYRRSLPRGTDRSLYDLALCHSRHLGHAEPVILDVGANCGQTALAFRGSIPEAVIYSFEPVPETFEKLRASLGQEPKHHCYCLALSDSNGECLMKVDGSSQENRILTARPLPVADQTTVKVKLSTLDDFMATEGLTHVTILKSDTEGHELQVLKGAQNALTSGHISSILIEASLVQLSEEHTQLGKLIEQLEVFDYVLFGLYDLGYRYTGRMQGKLKLFNAMFIHKSAICNQSPPAGE